MEWQARITTVHFPVFVPVSTTQQYIPGIPLGYIKAFRYKHKI